MKNNVWVLVIGLSVLCGVLAIEGYSINSVIDQNEERGVSRDGRHEMADVAWRPLFGRGR